MSFRDKINQNPAIAIVAVAAFVALAAYVLYSQVTIPTGVPTGAYYTVDNGATFFDGPLTELPPFDSNGKEAVKAYVFECDGKKFVGYMAKLNPEARTAILAHRKELEKKPTEMPATLMPSQAALRNGWLFKRPGDTKWAPGGPGFRFPVNCPDGKAATEATL